MLTVFTVGHSNHTADDFLGLLRRNGIEAVADVRSSPFSRHVPQFNKKSLEELLRAGGLTYVHLGDQLGGRPRDPACYREGKVRFDLVSRSPAFLEGLGRVREGAARFRLALLCAEKDPITCHRMILVCRRLKARDVFVQHIREDGSVEGNPDAENRLLLALKMPQGDLFRTRCQTLEEAYDRQGAEIAYEER